MTEPKRDEATALAEEIHFQQNFLSIEALASLIRPHLAPRPAGMEETEKRAAELEYIAKTHYGSYTADREYHALKEASTLLRALAGENARKQKEIDDLWANIQAKTDELVESQVKGILENFAQDGGPQK